MTRERERERTLDGRLGQRIDLRIGGVTGSWLMNTLWILRLWIIVLVRIVRTVCIVRIIHTVRIVRIVVRTLDWLYRLIDSFDSIIHSSFYFVLVDGLVLSGRISYFFVRLILVPVHPTYIRPSQQSVKHCTIRSAYRNPPYPIRVVTLPGTAKASKNISNSENFDLHKIPTKDRDGIESRQV